MSDEKLFVLPDTITSPTEVARLLREVEQLADFMGQARIRRSDEARLPAPTRLLSEICEQNNLNLLQEHDREQLAKALGVLKGSAPLLHMSFATDPSPQFMKRLVAWLRQEIHPYVLVQIGLQPTLGAGCTLRTSNKYFDFSLRQRLRERRDVLSEKLATVVAETTK